MKHPALAYAVWSWGLDDAGELEKALRDIKEAGFSYFESVARTMAVFGNRAGEFMELINREKVYPVSFYFTFSGDYAADLKTIKEALDFINASGAKRASISAPYNRGGASRGDMDRFCRALDDVVDLMSPSGIIPCLHPHTNTLIMFEDEIDYVMERSKIALGPDTAHLLAGGCDPVELFKRYAGRIKFVHLKDVKKDSGMQVDKAMNEDFEIYSDFLELGEGDVDIEGVFDVLDAAEYGGYITVELDKAPSSQRESAFKNMEYLKKKFSPRY